MEPSAAPKKQQPLASVAVPPSPVRVPSQRPLAPSLASVTKNKGDNLGPDFDDLKIL